MVIPVIPYELQCIAYWISANGANAVSRPDSSSFPPRTLSSKNYHRVRNVIEGAPHNVIVTGLAKGHLCMMIGQHMTGSGTSALIAVSQEPITQSPHFVTTIRTARSAEHPIGYNTTHCSMLDEGLPT